MINRKRTVTAMLNKNEKGMGARLQLFLFGVDQALFSRHVAPRLVMWFGIFSYLAAAVPLRCDFATHPDEGDHRRQQKNMRDGLSLRSFRRRVVL